MTDVLWEATCERDIQPYAPEAWIDHSKTKIGYEIPFTGYFYEYVPPRPLAEIDAELLEIEKRIQELLGGAEEVTRPNFPRRLSAPRNLRPRGKGPIGCALGSGGPR